MMNKATPYDREDVNWYRLAAEQANADASSLGEILRDGQGVAKPVIYLINQAETSKNSAV